MSNAELWTFQDAVEHVLDVFDDEREARPLRMARRACRDAYRELSMSHQWSYLDVQFQISTVASQTTGTIEYTHSTRTIELSDATFPEDARSYVIIIASIHYQIESYTDSTHVVLHESQNPGADVAAGTGYTLYKDSYLLPVDFTELNGLYDITSRYELPIILPRDVTADLVLRNTTPQYPRFATIMGDNDNTNRLALVFSPPPVSEKTYSCMYQRSPRLLVTEKFSAGTIAITSGSTTATITDGVFTQRHVGCVLRVGSATHEPTNVFGGIDGSDNIYSEETVIRSVAADGSTCTMADSFSVDYTNVRFTVSDPIDIEREAMLPAFLRLAEAAYTRLTKREMKDRMERERVARNAVLLAKERDTRAPVDAKIMWYNPFRHVTITDVP